MSSKQDQSHSPRPKQRVPSSGRGAASAMDALIKRRAPTPAESTQHGDPAQQPPSPKKQ